MCKSTARHCCTFPKGTSFSWKWGLASNQQYRRSKTSYLRVSSASWACWQSPYCKSHTQAATATQRLCPVAVLIFPHILDRRVTSKILRLQRDSCNQPHILGCQRTKRVPLAKFRLTVFSYPKYTTKEDVQEGFCYAKSCIPPRSTHWALPFTFLEVGVSCTLKRTKHRQLAYA